MLAMSVVLPANAQPPDPPVNETPPSGSVSEEAKQEAIVRFKRGLELYGEGAFAAALIEFRRANEIAPNWRLHYNIAQVCAQVQEYVCALESFATYLRQGAAEVPVERRAEVEREILRLEARVATLVVRANVDGAEVSLDDVPVGFTPLPARLTVNSGRHRVTVAKPGFVVAIRHFDAAGQESYDIDLTLVPHSTFSAPPARPSAKPAMTTWSWAFVGVAGALGVTAGITGAAALSASSNLKDTRYARASDAHSDQTRVKALALVTDVTAVAAVVTLGSTLAISFWPRSSGSSKVGTTVRLGPASAAIVGAF